MRIHTNERPFSCAVCQKQYRNTSALNVHLRTHDAEPSYCCDVCKERFVRLSSLNDHMRWHTGERPYICTECGTEFSRLRDMKRHIRVHSGAMIRSLTVTKLYQYCRFTAYFVHCAKKYTVSEKKGAT